MSATTVTLNRGREEAAEWRVIVSNEHGETQSLGTTIHKSTPTAIVVKLVRGMFPTATVKSQAGEVLYPTPPGGFPKIHSSQP